MNIKSIMLTTLISVTCVNAYADPFLVVGKACAAPWSNVYMERQAEDEVALEADKICKKYSPHTSAFRINGFEYGELHHEGIHSCLEASAMFSCIGKF